MCSKIYVFLNQSWSAKFSKWHPFFSISLQVHLCHAPTNLDPGSFILVFGSRFSLALIGNVIVILVIIFSRTKMDVSRFLLWNLACANLDLSIYLGFLAGVDAATLGVFRQYGIHWQLSPGCGAAGFLAPGSLFIRALDLYIICDHARKVLRYKTRVTSGEETKASTCASHHVLWMGVCVISSHATVSWC